MPGRRHPHGGRLLRGGSGRPPRPAGRRGAPDRSSPRDRELPRYRSPGRGRPPDGRRGGPSRLRLPGRERGLRRGVPHCGPRVRGSAARGDRPDGRQDSGAPRGRRGGRADRARDPGTGGIGCGGPPGREGSGLPGDDQGGPGGRREGHAARVDPGRARVGAAAGALRGGRRVRGRRGLRREGDRRAPPRRDPGPRGCPRAVPAPGRARVLDPAAAPEARRGVPVVCRGRGAPGRDGRGGLPAPGLGGLPERRHGRVPSRLRRALLLPRGQHAPPGRASGHRAGNGYRSRPGAAPPGGRRGARVLPGGRGSARLGDRVPHLRRGSCRRIHPVPGPDRDVASAGRALGAGGQRGLRGRRSVAPLRSPDGEAHRMGPRSRRRGGPDAPGAR